MTKQRLYRLIKRHGGIRRIHVHPCGCAGWCQTVVCADGWRRRLSLREQRWVDEAKPLELAIVH